MRKLFSGTAIALAIAILSFSSPAHAAGNITPFKVKAIKVAGDTDVTRLAYTQGVIEGALFNQGMLVKTDGMMMEITTTWTESEVGKMRALTITARLFQADKISYSIAVKSGGARSIIQPLALNDDKYLINEAAKAFVAELQKQIGAQRQAMQIATNTPTRVALKQ